MCNNAPAGQEPAPSLDSVLVVFSDCVIALSSVVSCPALPGRQR